MGRFWSYDSLNTPVLYETQAFTHSTSLKPIYSYIWEKYGSVLKAKVPTPESWDFFCEKLLGSVKGENHLGRKPLKMSAASSSFPFTSFCSVPWWFEYLVELDFHIFSPVDLPSTKIWPSEWMVTFLCFSLNSLAIFHLLYVSFERIATLIIPYKFRKFIIFESDNINFILNLLFWLYYK